ncbi:hypothetical protein ES703_107873 [subsurface metagenome]
MVNAPPQNANEFIEQRLKECALAIENSSLKADVLSFNGPLFMGVDDIVRNVIEAKRKDSPNRRRLAVILTTTGGYIEVVHRIVDTFRHHYKYVDFIIPNYAYSAGTVFAMSGDAIYMDYYSRLGPIDPQVETSSGRQVSALGYLIQWERLLEKAKKGKLTIAEAQLMIDGFDQAELYRFEQERELSIALLEEWLVKYKFKNWKITQTKGLKVNQKMRKQRASSIAKELNNTQKWHTHGHGISMTVLQRDLKLLIDDYGQNPDLSAEINNYHNLLTDYMVKRGNTGIIHVAGAYLPFLSREV